MNRLAVSATRSRWPLALAAALLFLGLDSITRLRGASELSAASIGGARAISADTASPSGYDANQHQAILPILGSDGYHWAMQTQQMLADGAVRVRHVDYDGPPGGRDVHWSSWLRWWTAALAGLTSLVRDIRIAQAVESVAPWANTLILGLLLATLVPLVARRFGSAAASVLAIGMVAAYPAYEFYAIGNFDHHGLASSAALLSVLFLIGGGAGWVKTGDASAYGGTGVVAMWLLDERSARRWFIASGVAGGVGLSVSAATQLPALAGIGLGALACAAMFPHDASPRDGWRTAKHLWRVWGVAGATTSVCLYLLEYAPADMSLRLEVNHPLYALAWLGGGELMCRVWDRARSRVNVAWITGCAVALAIVPAVVLLQPDAFILQPDSLVMALHEDYIDEFRGLVRQIADWSWIQFVAGVGVLPLVIAGPAIAAGLSKRIAPPLRTVAILSVMPALLYTMLAFRHGRWLGIGMVLWLGVCVAVATIATLTPERWMRPRARLLAAAGAILAFVPFPAYAMSQWGKTGSSFAPTPGALTQVVVRDVSYKLRARLGPERGVVASDPTATTRMIYFGGVRGVGTLYWENHEGLAASARLFGAIPQGDRSAADVALDDIRTLGVTHIVLFSWDPFVVEYARLARGIRAHAAFRDVEAAQAFGPQLLQGVIPMWLRPLPYVVPPIAGLEGAWVLVLEVAAEQTAPEAATRAAQYALAMNDEASALRTLNGALEADPAYLPALIALARVQQAKPSLGDYRATLQRVAARGRAVDSLALEDQVGLASVYVAAGDTLRARARISRALADADERKVRRLPWDYTAANLIVIARQLGLTDARPEILDLAYRLLDPAIQARLGR